MAAAVCSECRVEAKGNPAVIVHAPGCPIGIERQQRAELARLERIAECRVAAEQLLENLRDLVERQVAVVDELDCEVDAIAEAAKLGRSRIYQLLDS